MFRVSVTLIRNTSIFLFVYSFGCSTHEIRVRDYMEKSMQLYEAQNKPLEEPLRSQIIEEFVQKELKTKEY